MKYVGWCVVLRMSDSPCLLSFGVEVEFGVRGERSQCDKELPSTALD